MSLLPNEFQQAWEDREGPVVFTTVSNENIPNAIYATCVGLFENKIVIANNYFDKTLNNISNGSTTGSALFITKGGNAYQVKGKIEYHTEGPVFDNMKSWNPEKHPGHAAAAICIDEIYSGAKKLL